MPAALRRAAGPAEVAIRPGRLNDVPALLDIEARSFRTDRLSRRSFRHLLTRGHTISLVAERRGRVVGYIIVLLHRGTSLARVYSFAIDPAHRGRGVGAALLDEAERRARAGGCAYVRLEVRPDNAAAIARYRAAGYREFGSYPDYYEDHSAALRMEKALGGARPKLARVPFYAQTLEFTCGAACLMMAMKALNPRIALERRVELQLWRESTTVFMTTGLGGCGPYGLALAAHRRGFDVRIHVNDPGALFVDSVRSAEKKEVIRLVEADFRAQVAEARIPVVRRALSRSDIGRALARGAIPIVLISSYRLSGEKAPHWVVVTGRDDRFLYLHDPFVDWDRHRITSDCVNLPIAWVDFEAMARYGSSRLRAAVVVGRRRSR